MIPLFDGNNYLVYLAGIAGLLNACLQMPLATLLHMTSHTLGRNQQARAFLFSLAMSAGVFLTISLLLIITILAASAIPNDQARHLLAGIVTTLAGLFVMLRYFRDDAGAQLWLPRKNIRWFHKQIECIGNSFGAFGMGMLAVLTEIGLAFPLLLSAGVLLVNSDPSTVITGLGVYAFIVTLPLLLTGLNLAGGASPLGLQRWRADGKRFWQFFIGLAFIIFGLYIASEQFLYGVEAFGAIV